MALIGEGDRCVSKNSKFCQNHGILAVFCPAAAISYTDQAETWKGKIQHGFTLSRHIWLLFGRRVGTGAPSFKALLKLRVFGGFHYAEVTV